MIVQLHSGLGNQMFIYAFAKSLSMRGHTILLDASVFQSNTANISNENIRRLELDSFNISIPVCYDNKKVQDYMFRHDFLMRLKIAFHYLYYKLAGRHDKYHQTMLKFYAYKQKETQFVGTNQILDDFLNNTLYEHTYYRGCFQNLAYFENIDSVIRQEFQLKDSLQGHNAAWEQKIRATPNSVFLHVRRGDYIHGEVNGTYVKLDKTYYQAAIHIIREKLANPYIFVFSNDIEWCEDNLANMLDLSGCHVDFVKGNDEGNAAYEMQLMRSCKHAIIANSTFSWWAAYLMENPDKLVIIPNQIFNSAHRIPQMSMLSQKGFIEVDITWGTHRVIE